MKASDQEPARVWSAGRRHYVMLILCLVGLFNLIDRQIITILIEPIKREFGASDTVMGLLTGLIFAGFYLAASVPLARVADTGVRRTLMAVCLGAWSLMTALGGFAQNILQLGLTRVGVAIGEAGAGPTSHSMISDLYPLKSRGTMLSLFIGMQAIGIGVGVFLGGWLSDHFSWRTAFFVVGVPGMILAAIIMLTVKEPPRGMSDGQVKADTSPKPSFKQVAARLWSMRSYRFVALTVLLGALPGYGTLGWGPTFFLRVHHLSPTVVGFWFGLTAALALFLGSVLSGVLGDWGGRRDMRWYMRVAAFGPLLAAPLGLAFLFSSSPVWAFVFIFLMQFTLALHNPPCNAMAQALAPTRMRAMASVVMAIMTSVVGIGLAPLAIGALNDALTPHFGESAIRYSLAFTFLGALAATVTALLSTRWLREDFERTQAEFA